MYVRIYGLCTYKLKGGYKKFDKKKMSWERDIIKHWKFLDQLYEYSIASVRLNLFS